MSPLVSVVIPTWNRAPLLADCLRSLRGQDYPADGFEIVVADDGSVDETAEVVRAMDDRGTPRVRHVRLAHGGVNAARNAGMTAAQGDPVCFIEDDVDLPPGWLAAMMDGVRRHPESGCFGGPIRVRFEARPPRICEMESWIWEGELDYGPTEHAVEHVNGGNFAVRRWAVEAVGPFNTALIVGDETEWEMRLRRSGIPIVYLPEAWLWHRRTAADLRRRKLLRRRFRRGVAYADYAAVVGERISVTRVLWPIPFYAAHAVRRRCFGAVLEIARKLGTASAELGRRAGRRGRP